MNKPVLKDPLPIHFVTIDSASTKDIDDAIYVEFKDDDFHVYVAIANPTSIIKVGSTEDIQAQLMAATAYVRDYPVRRMLPPQISEYECSLVLGKTRPTLLLHAVLDSNLEVKSFELTFEIIKVEHKISYDEIPAVLGNAEHPANAMLTLASTLSKSLLQFRRKNGAMALFDLSKLLITDEDGNLKQLSSIEETIGHIIVQEMMILSNTLFARYMIENNIPGIFRNHIPKLAAPSSNEVAETLAAWLSTKSFDMNMVQQQFSAIAQKATYGASSSGHYGLNLPCYLHATSPLRRYADLVNIRQIKAFIKKRPFKYTVDELKVITEGLNEALSKRKEERAEGFKDVVKRTAERALNNGELSRLAAHEMSQAIKLALSSDELPEALSNELARRFETFSISDKELDAFIVELPNHLISEALSVAFRDWMSANIHKSFHIMVHAQNTAFIKEFSTVTEQVDGVFKSKAELYDVNGRLITAQGSAARKKEAEQIAAAYLVFKIKSITYEDVFIKPTQLSEENKNFKGALMELCQKNRWPMPIFSASAKGPSHAMIFSGSVRLKVGDQEFIGTAENCQTKKVCELIASKDLLSQLSELDVRPGKKEPEKSKSENKINFKIFEKAAVESNPIGALLEYIQKHRFSMPIYTYKMISTTPSMFECSIKASLDKNYSLAVKAGTKQDAKQAASLGLIELIESES